jgi:lipoyl-dependent peroxiredoxin
MPVRTAEAEWKGDLPKGSGKMKTGTGSFDGAYSFGTRFEEVPGTNPEELIAAAHAGCFSMAFSNQLAKAGFTPTSVKTTAKVHLEKGEAGFGITKIELVTRAVVPGVDEQTFREKAEAAKTGCPISKALAAVPTITLDAQLAK